MKKGYTHPGFITQVTNLTKEERASHKTSKSLKLFSLVLIVFLTNLSTSISADIFVDDKCENIHAVVDADHTNKNLTSNILHPNEIRPSKLSHLTHKTANMGFPFLGIWDFLTSSFDSWFRNDEQEVAFDKKDSIVAKSAIVNANCYDGCLLQPGQSIITCGSFEPNNNSVAVGQRLDEKVIGMFDTRDPVANGGVLGANWSSLSGAGTAPSAQWNARNLGEVYGMTTKPNTAAGCQDFYIAQWGMLPGGLNEGGSIYQGDLATACNGGAVFKIDGVTGNASLFACLPSIYGNIPARVFDVDGSDGGGTITGTFDTYTGLGQITYNKECDAFYVSNLNDGLIYVLDGTGNQLGTYDFGADGLPGVVTNDGNAGHLASYVDANNQILDDTNEALTQWQRRVLGVGYNMHDDRLYFGTIRKRFEGDPNAVGTNATAQPVYSVAIDPATCLPIASTTTNEFYITSGDRSPVSDIVFDVNNNLLLSQINIATVANKGAHSADLMLWQGGTGNWALTTTYETSTYLSGGGSAGGVDFGYNNYSSNPDLAAGNCPEESIVFTVDAALGINDPAIYGPGIMPWAGGAVDQVAYLIDADSILDQRNKFAMGDIEVISPACNLTELNLICSADNSTFTIVPDHVQDILCDYTISASQGDVVNMRTNSIGLGDPCQQETFSFSGNVDCAQPVTITVTIPDCAGSKPCTFTQVLPCCPVSSTCPEPNCFDITVQNN